MALMAEELVVVTVLSLVNLPFPLYRHPAVHLRRHRDNLDLCQVLRPAPWG